MRPKRRLSAFGFERKADISVSASLNLIAFETHSFVSAVAKRLVRGFPATAERNTAAVPSIAPAAIPDRQAAVKH